MEPFGKSFANPVRLTLVVTGALLAFTAAYRATRSASVVSNPWRHANRPYCFLGPDVPIPGCCIGFNIDGDVPHDCDMRDYSLWLLQKDERR